MTVYPYVCVTSLWVTTPGAKWGRNRCVLSWPIAGAAPSTSTVNGRSSTWSVTPYLVRTHTHVHECTYTHRQQCPQTHTHTHTPLSQASSQTVLFLEAYLFESYKGLNAWRTYANVWCIINTLLAFSSGGPCFLPCLWSGFIALIFQSSLHALSPSLPLALSLFLTDTHT